MMSERERTHVMLDIASSPIGPPPAVEMECMHIKYANEQIQI